jgi:hypothetical protein
MKNNIFCFSALTLLVMLFSALQSCSYLPPEQQRVVSECKRYTTICSPKNSYPGTAIRTQTLQEVNATITDYQKPFRAALDEALTLVNLDEAAVRERFAAVDNELFKMAIRIAWVFKFCASGKPKAAQNPFGRSDIVGDYSKTHNLDDLPMERILFIRQAQIRRGYWVTIDASHLTPAQAEMLIDLTTAKIDCDEIVPNEFFLVGLHLKKITSRKPLFIASTTLQWLIIELCTTNSLAAICIPGLKDLDARKNYYLESFDDFTPPPTLQVLGLTVTTKAEETTIPNLFSRLPEDMLHYRY